MNGHPADVPRADILIVDEILAVGDQAFQTKCLDAIMQMRDQGVTIVIVSHNLNVMRTLCTHMLWMDKGGVRAWGTVDDIAAEYQAYAYEREALVSKVGADGTQRQGSQEVEITAVRFLNEQGEEKHTYITGDPMTIEMAYTAHKPVNNPEFGLAIFRQDGLHVNGPNTKLAGVDLGWLHGPGVVRYQIEQLPLLPARYEVTTAVHDGQTHACYTYQKRAHAFRVLPGGADEMDGLIAMPATWAWAADEAASPPVPIEEATLAGAAMGTESV